MQVYIYAADVYCEDCGQAICERIRQERKQAGLSAIDESDPFSFDSYEFPKGPNDPGESDCPQHCGSGGRCINCIDLADIDPDESSGKIGAFLENDLTTDGVEYVVTSWLDNYQHNPVVVNYWVQQYSEMGYDLEANVAQVKVSLSWERK